MLQVAICEDIEIDRRLLEKIVSSLMRERGIAFEIEVFGSGEALIDVYKNHPYHLIFMDIMMDGMDGIETGRQIRKMDANVEIVYCTASEDFAIAAYDIHAMGYLLKPYEPRRIGAMIDYYVQKNPQSEQNFIEVKSRRKSLVIPYNDIIYMESDNKVIYIYTRTRGEIKVYNRLDVLEQQVSHRAFLRCHQSYLVNLQYVVGLVDSDFIMVNDDMVPIRKSGRKLIIKKYEEYLKNN